MIENQHPRSLEKDERFVYGARCSFQGPIAMIGRRPMGPGSPGLPCCPHCRGPLFEMESEKLWDQGIAIYAEMKQDADYPNFMAWIKKTSEKTCMPMRTQVDFDNIRATYERQKEQKP